MGRKSLTVALSYGLSFDGPPLAAERIKSPAGAPAFLFFWENATLANRQFQTYGPDSWGLNVSEGPDGYRAYGAPPGRVEHDGAVAPTETRGAMVFTPELSLRALLFLKRTYGDRLWGRYGFADAFNTDPRWRVRCNAEGMWRSPGVRAGLAQAALPEKGLR